MTPRMHVSSRPAVAVSLGMPAAWWSSAVALAFAVAMARECGADGGLADGFEVQLEQGEGGGLGRRVRRGG